MSTADAPALTPSAEVRRRRGVAIATICRIVEKDGSWIVPSQSGGKAYRVHLEPPDASVPQCTCKDFETRGEPCKHVFAVRASLDPANRLDPPTTDAEVVAIAKQVKATRPTYKQNWPAYNAAQIHEKAKFLELLGDLCQGVQEPPRPHKGLKGGRPPVPMADRVFSTALKVYTTLSGRRSSTDMRDARDKGHLSHAPHYSRVSRFLEDPEMTPLLKAMIAESAGPLASVEEDFAADSSGFTTCRFESWYDHKYGVVRRQHEWVKVHIMVGVKTNVITAVEIKGKDAQDAPQLPAMLRTTAGRFTMREVSCDKVYASLDNYAEISGHGATPYIPFKSIHTGAGGGMWAKMYHYYQFNRDEFLGHYHKRSNIESTFSMMKAKFGDFVRSKTDVAMVNEALCKVLCHNVCCLIQSVYELGVVTRFWALDGAIETLEIAARGEETGEEWAWV